MSDFKILLSNIEIFQISIVGYPTIYLLAVALVRMVIGVAEFHPVSENHCEDYKWITKRITKSACEDYKRITKLLLKVPVRITRGLQKGLQKCL